MMRKIQSQIELDKLLEKFDWSHGFIREIAVISPSYVEKESIGTVAPDSSVFMKLLITFSDQDYPGLELIFEEVDDLGLTFRTDLSPIGRIDSIHSSVDLYLNGLKMPGIRAKALWYTMLDEACWGWQVRYIIDNPFDEGGFLAEVA